jgi:hypothetical protein
MVRGEQWHLHEVVFHYQQQDSLSCNGSWSRDRILDILMQIGRNQGFCREILLQTAFFT